MKNALRRGLTGPILLFAGVMLLASGCVVGKKVDYSYTAGSEKTVGKGRKILISFPDDVRERATKIGPDAVGTMRSGVGVPWPIKTLSGEPFAKHLGIAIRDELRALGFAAKLAPPPPMKSDALVEELPDGAMGLQIKIEMWHHDTYVATNFGWEIRLRVVTPGGDVVYKKKFEGKKELEGSFGKPIKTMQRVMPGEFAEVIRELIRGNKKLVLLLRDGPAPADSDYPDDGGPGETAPVKPDPAEPDRPADDDSGEPAPKDPFED